MRVMTGRVAGLTVLAAALGLGLGDPAWAGSPTEQLRAYTDRVMEVLENRAMTSPERVAAMRAVATEAFDVSETAQRALGIHWQQRTPAEKQEFVQIFRGLLEQTYLSRIGEFGGERIRYVNERIDGDRAIVRAVIVTRNGTEVPVESRLLQKADRWLIYDILIENISLIASYRSQFDRVIRTASYPELVRRLKSHGSL